MGIDYSAGGRASAGRFRATWRAWARDDWPTMSDVDAPSPDQRAPELSIVIPAFNEAHKIALDVQAAGQFLAQQNLSGEIIISDDGSEDNTAGAARACTVSG